MFEPDTGADAVCGRYLYRSPVTCTSSGSDLLRQVVVFRLRLRLRPAPMPVALLPDGTIRMWNLDRSQAIDDLTAYPADTPVAAVVTTLTNDHRVVVTAGESHLLTIWDLASISPIEHIRLASRPRGVTAHQDDLVLAGDQVMLALRIRPNHRTSPGR